MNIDTGVATFLPNAHRPVFLSEIEAGVDNAGFELLWLELELLGTISEAADPANGLQLKIADTSQAFPLVEGSTDSERETFARLRELTGQTVTIRGRTEKSPPGPLVLVEFSTN